MPNICRSLFLVLCILGTFSLYSQELNEEVEHPDEIGENVEKTFDQVVDEAIGPVADFVDAIIFYSVPLNKDVDIPLILIWLVGGAIIFTFYLKFINITGIRHAFQIIKGKYTHKDDPGEVTHFQALATALSGTVGLGNIAGVAIAISLGGPGATFWMVLTGIFSMTSKFVECTLGVKFRDVHADGSVSGGPMYYLTKGFSARGWGRTGRFLAAFFAVMCVCASMASGNMFQINQAAQQFIGLPYVNESFLVDSAWVFGLFIAVCVAVVIIGGIKSIAKVTEKIVPLMAILYVGAALVVLLVNWQHIPEAMGDIFRGAFDRTSIAGGLVGVMIMGMRRAAFSNEAGVGSASIAHSAVKTSEPVTEGFVASLEPFVDTVVVCTMTALVIIISGTYKLESADGIQITSAGFATVIDWFPYVLSFAVILFAFSTMISWSYYGLKSWTFLFGKSNFSELSYKFIFCCFIVIGASISLNKVVILSDAMIFAMSIPNLFGLYILAPLVKRDMESFLTRVNKGKIDTFD